MSRRLRSVGGVGCMLVGALLACGSDEGSSTSAFGNMPGGGLGGSPGSQPNVPVGGAPGVGGQVAANVGGSSSEMNPPVSGISGSGGATGVTGGSGNMPAQGGSGGAPPNTGGTGGSSVQPPMVATNFPNCPPFPPNSGQQNVGSTMQLSGSFDGGMRRFVGTGALGGSGQEEGQEALFELANNTTLRNVIIGSPAADGIHCAGNCTLQNVWWEDVGEDAATFRGDSDNIRVTISCGGARAAADKVFQHNGAGTVVINDFYVENFGKLYRSCGNCDDSFDRHVEVTNLLARAPGGALVGVNSNFGDTAILRNILLIDASLSIQPCERYTGTTDGEPVRNGVGPDGQTCRYQPSDIVYVRAP